MVTLMRIDSSLPSAPAGIGSSPIHDVQRLLQLALRQIADTERADRRACAYYIEQALRLHRHAASVRARSGTHNGLAPWQVATVEKVALARLDNNLSISDLASACRLSRGYFSRAFKATFGESPHRWRHKKRIEHACRQIVGTTDTLAQIAVACGFNDQAHFTRSFKAAVGTTPHLYRKGAGEQGASC